MNERKSFVFRFRDVEVREREFTLVKAGEVLPVQPKVFSVLLFLLHNPQRLVTKEELMTAVWGDVAVTESSLTRIIALLRGLLGDDIHVPRYIATVAKVGYRLVCPVEAFEEAAAAAAPAGPAANGNRSEEVTIPNGELDAGQRIFRRRWLLAAAVPVLGLGPLGWYLLQPLPSLHIASYTKLTHDGHEKWPRGTDGSRVYFTDFVDGPIAQVSVAGGETARVPVAIPYVSHLESVSPDGSSLIVDTDEKGIVFERPQWIVSMLGGSLRRLPDGAGATFSPDGQSVLYATSDGGIWLVQSDGTGAHKVTTLEGAGGFAWAPDGRAIRFKKENRIWEMSSNGSDPHPLLTGRRPPGGQCCGRWAADGKFFIFRSGNLGTGDTGIWAIDERRRLFLSPQPVPVQLTSGPVRWGEFVPSKDSGKIYAEGETPRGELSRYDARTKHFLPFLGGISAGCVSFSRDGRFVAYVLYPEGTLWKANRDGSNPVRLSDPPISAHNPRWSPDGKQIVFTDLANVTYTSLDNRPSEVYVVSAEGGSPQRLLPDDKGPGGDPTWSPDGRRIAYGWSRSVEFGATPEIRILDLASGRITVVPGSVGTSSPRWSPDGRYIAGIGQGQGSLRVYDTVTQQWSTLAEKGLAYDQWSKDSRWIYFVAEDAVERVSVKSGKEERVAELNDWPIAGWWGWMGLDPGDAPMVLHDIGSQDIYALTLDEK
jgi:Tol biopolymer transport system component/DNA-binding winged helix-turn-helix (wHTH) protein